MQVALLKKLIPLPAVGKPAPSEVLLFVWGPNPTTKGTFQLTRESAAAAIRLYEEQGHALTFDYDHATLEPYTPPSERKSAGACHLAITDAGLAAVNCQWTPAAKQGIETGEWVFISPAIVFDAKSKTITGVRNIALTNLPATHGARPLLMNARSGMDTKIMKDLRAAYEACMAAAQAMQAGEEPMKTLGASAIEGLAPLISALEAEIEKLEPGAMPAGEGEFNALRGLRELAAELLGAKDADTATLKGKLRALSQKVKTAESRAADAERNEVKALVAANLSKIPAAEVETYSKLSKVELLAYLSDAPTTAPVKPAPTAPAIKLDKAPKPADAQAERDAQEILGAARVRTQTAGTATAEDDDVAQILAAAGRRVQAQAQA